MRMAIQTEGKHYETNSHFSHFLRTRLKMYNIPEIINCLRDNGKVDNDK